MAPMGKLVDFLALANAAFGRYASTPMTARSHADENAVAVLKAGANDGLVVELASGSEAPLPSGAATAAKQDDNIDAIKDLQSATVFKYYAAFAADTNLVTDGGGLCRRVIVGKSGTLVLTKNDDTDETLPAEICTDGAVLDIRAKAIKNTSSATKVLVMW